MEHVIMCFIPGAVFDVSLYNNRGQRSFYVAESRWPSCCYWT